MVKLYYHKYPTHRTISARHKKLVDAYFEFGFVKERALKAAGYAHSSYATRVFEHPDVIAEIDRRRKKLAEKLDLTREWIVTRLMMLADANIQLAKFKKVDEHGVPYWDFTGATPEELAMVNLVTEGGYADGRDKGSKGARKFKVEIPDPKAALDSLAKIQGLFEQTINVKGEVDLISRIQAGRQRAAQEDKPE